MHIKVTKPVRGLVDVVLDDRRGVTGFYEVHTSVDLGDLGTLVSARATVRQERKQAIKDARKGVKP